MREMRIRIVKESVTPDSKKPTAIFSKVLTEAHRRTPCLRKIKSKRRDIEMRSKCIVINSGQGKFQEPDFK